MERYGGAARGGWRRPTLRQRAGALGLTVAVELLLILLVIAFGGERVRRFVKLGPPTSIVFVPNPTPAPAPPALQRAERQPAKPPAPVAPALPVPTPKHPPPVLPRLKPDLPFIPLSRSELAAGDISKLGTAGGAPAGRSAGAGESSAAVGTGPGGVTLYNAEWVREPTNAELRGFLPGAVGDGSWALIACQTIAHNHVENCEQLGESPRGSGLSKAMRLAAWQFLVRPPRIDGKPMVGSWVRIRISFGAGKDDD
jgi:hypothetical protein